MTKTPNARGSRSKRGKSSDRWLKRQQRDPYTRQAAAEGNVSRAHYKLAELDQRFGLLKRGMVVLELGAAPGGWTGYVESRIGTEGLLIACDTRPVQAGANTRVICGEYGEVETDAAIEAALGERRLELVLSDMAPNMSGIRTTDQARSMDLVDLATDAAERWLKRGGTLVVKVFQGSGVDAWVAETRKRFVRVKMVKPKASRPESREVYGVAEEFLGPGMDRG